MDVYKVDLHDEISWNRTHVIYQGTFSSPAVAIIHLPKWAQDHPREVTSAYHEGSNLVGIYGADGISYYITKVTVNTVPAGSRLQEHPIQLKPEEVDVLPGYAMPREAADECTCFMKNTFPQHGWHHQTGCPQRPAGSWPASQG